MSAAELNNAKKVAAESAVNSEITENIKVIGIGSGSTIVPAVQRLAELFHGSDENAPMRKIRCVPTSFQATNLIVEHGLPLSSLSVDPVLDVAIDGADEVDAELNCIKGGGACHFQEKLVASNAKRFVLIADWRKNSEILGTNWTKGIPVSVFPPALEPVKIKIQKLGGTPKLRMAQQKAGPVVTDDGAFILDVDFGPIQPKDVTQLDIKLHMIPGVVDTGFFQMADIAYFGNADGTLATRIKPEIQMN